MDVELRDLLRGFAREQGVPALTAVQVAKAVATMPARRAAGLDHWTVQQLRGQPGEAWDSMPLILNAIEERG